MRGGFVLLEMRERERTVVDFNISTVITEP